MAGKAKSLIKSFGLEAAGALKAYQVADGLGIPLYCFNRRVYNGRFPQPDFVGQSLRGWRLRTIEAHDPRLAKRLFRLLNQVN